MSENQPEINDIDLDQVAGGTEVTPYDHLKLHSEMYKTHMATESADSLNKRLSEIKKSLEHDLKK